MHFRALALATAWLLLQLFLVTALPTNVGDHTDSLAPLDVHEQRRAIGGKGGLSKPPAPSARPPPARPPPLTETHPTRPPPPSLSRTFPLQPSQASSVGSVPVSVRTGSDALTKSIVDPVGIVNSGRSSRTATSEIASSAAEPLSPSASTTRSNSISASGSSTTGRISSTGSSATGLTTKSSSSSPRSSSVSTSRSTSTSRNNTSIVAGGSSEGRTTLLTSSSSRDAKSPATTLSQPLITSSAGSRNSTAPSLTSSASLSSATAKNATALTTSIVSIRNQTACSVNDRKTLTRRAGSGTEPGSGCSQDEKSGTPQNPHILKINYDDVETTAEARCMVVMCYGVPRSYEYLRKSDDTKAQRNRVGAKPSLFDGTDDQLKLKGLAKPFESFTSPEDAIRASAAKFGEIVPIVPVDPDENSKEGGRYSGQLTATKAKLNEFVMDSYFSGSGKDLGQYCSAMQELKVNTKPTVAQMKKVCDTAGKKDLAKFVFIKRQKRGAESAPDDQPPAKKPKTDNVAGDAVDNDKRGEESGKDTSKTEYRRLTLFKDVYPFQEEEPTKSITDTDEADVETDEPAEGSKETT